MKNNNLILPVAFTGLSLAGSLMAQTYTLNGNDITIYHSNGSILSEVVNPTIPSDLNTALSGNLANAGGNIELFATSDTLGQSGNFATAAHTSIDVDFGNNCVVNLSSLNGEDWFNNSSGTYDLAYDASNLANQWFDEFSGEWFDDYSQALTLLSFIQPALAATLPTTKEDLFESFRDNGGFAQLSDPNISYVEESGGTVTVGLGGFLDASPRIVELISAATAIDSSLLSSLIPSGLQYSEVVLIDGEAHYGFSASASGVVLLDGKDSYSGTYVVEHSKAVPEPSSALLLGLSSALLLGRRKR